MKREGGAAGPGSNDSIEGGPSEKMANGPNDSDHGVGSGLVSVPKSLTPYVGVWKRFPISHCVCLSCSPPIHSARSCRVNLAREKSHRIIP